jgi:DNA-binding transcriptional ArsR family regulator
VDAALKAIAEPRRREIAAHFGSVTRSAISQHLGVLKAAGLVTERREGTRRLYRARQDEMRRLREFLDEFWTTGLDRLRDLAEAAQREKDEQPREGDIDGGAHP